MLTNQSIVNMDLQKFADDIGILSAGTTLRYRKSGSGGGGGGSNEWYELDVITSTPDIGSEPERVDVTTLADSKRKYIKGIEDSENLSFPCVYRNEVFAKVKSDEEDGGQYQFQLTYPDRAGFDFAGEIATTVSGAEINGALAFTLIVIPHSGPDFVSNRPATP